MKNRLISIPANTYNQSIVRLIRNTTEAPVCYISLNKTYNAMLQILKENRVSAEKYYFIDFVSPTIFKIKKEERCVYLESLDLNNLADVLLNLIKTKKIKAIIFDSMSSLLVYKTDAEVVEFFNYVLSFLEKLNVYTTLVCLAEDYTRPSIKQIMMRVDDVIVKKQR
jgi:KaiC/GvpD/RAD55 family RecA-like ATPase